MRTPRKVRLFSGIIPINLLNLLLVLVIHFAPESPLRVVIGIPFILFFPGYALIYLLFPRRHDIGFLERIILSISISVAISALIGFGLNYTLWGIQINPLLISISLFTLIVSIIGIIRSLQFPKDHRFSAIIPDEKPTHTAFSNKGLNVAVAVAIVATISVLIYTVSNPKPGEQFSEFYILGFYGQAADYPKDFLLRADGKFDVKYGLPTEQERDAGYVTVGLINSRTTSESYSIRISINGRHLPMLVDNKWQDQYGPIELSPGASIEVLVGFRPETVAVEQKVVFNLYRGSSDTPERKLHFWINVSEHY